MIIGQNIYGIYIVCVRFCIYTYTYYYKCQSCYLVSNNSIQSVMLFYDIKTGITVSNNLTITDFHCIII